ncbi:MAG TPA: precorrin-8X methylmutase [Anaerolineae bacterium]|jgi:sirohydrochlorin cobaltochelatase
MSEKNTDALLLIGHGSRDAEAVAEYDQFAGRLAGHIGLPVYPCFLEFADPPIVEGIRACVKAGTRRVTALPLFLGPAGHQKNDVPAIVNWARTEWPQIEFKYGTPLGPQPQIIDLLAQRAAEAIAAGPTDIAAADTALIVIGRGSRDPDSNSDLYKIARMLWEGRGYGWVEAAFYALTAPDIETVIERCVRLGARRIVSLPFLLFTGLIRRRLDEQVLAARSRYPDVEILTAAHLGSHQRLIEAVLYRYEQVTDGEAAMTCDLCKYRHSFAGFEAEHGLPQTSDHHHGLRGVPHSHGPDGHHHHHHHHHDLEPDPLPISDVKPDHEAQPSPEIDPVEQDPATITANSFAIIRRELTEAGITFDDPLASIIERIIHSTADFEFADLTRLSPGALEAGIEALRSGCAVVTDVNMVRTGISDRRLSELGGSLHCLVAGAETRQQAAMMHTTRSAMGLKLAAEQGLLDGGIVVIGNAPTALYEVIRLIETGLHPALVIGVPVGFVSTIESKAALMQLNTVPWITTAGRKGGSPVAVAIVNALLRLAANVPATATD